MHLALTMNITGQIVELKSPSSELKTDNFGAYVQVGFRVHSGLAHEKIYITGNFPVVVVELATYHIIVSLDRSKGHFKSADQYYKFKGLQEGDAIILRELNMDVIRILLTRDNLHTIQSVARFVAIHSIESVQDTPEFANSRHIQRFVKIHQIIKLLKFWSYTELQHAFYGFSAYVGAPISGRYFCDQIMQTIRTTYLELFILPTIYYDGKKMVWHFLPRLRSDKMSALLKFREREFGYKASSEFGIVYAYDETIRQIEDAGVLVTESKRNLNKTINQEVFDRMLRFHCEKIAIGAEIYYFPKWIDNYCTAFTQKILQLISTENSLPLNHRSSKFPNLYKTLSLEQRRAVDIIQKSNVLFLTGPPGAGKSTCANAIYHCFSKRASKKSPQLNIVVTAAFNRVAANLYHVCKHAANLMYLEFQHLYGVNGRLADADVVIIDEAALLNIESMHRFFLIAKNLKKLVLIADPNQTPNTTGIGFAKALIEVCRSTETLVELTKVFRTDRNEILDNCRAICNGDLDALHYSDFLDATSVFRILDPQKDLVAQINTIKECNNYQNNYCEPGTYLIMTHRRYNVKALTGPHTLVPMATVRINENVHGRTETNKALSSGKFSNGQLLVIEEIVDHNTSTRGAAQTCVRDSLTDGKRYARNSRVVKFTNGSQLNLSHCTTTNVSILFSNGEVSTGHQSIGSEVDHVIIYLDEDNPFVTRQLLYTMVSRAKRTVTIIGRWEDFVKACNSVFSHSKILNVYINKAAIN